MAPLDSLEERYDAVVVGARAAGAATAMLLARRGAKLLAVDRGAYGSDTLSTLALMRVGVLQLARWGLLDRVVEAGTPAVRRTVFHYDDGDVDVPIKPRDGVPALFAPRRTVLDRILVDAATEAGTTVRHGVHLADLVRGTDGRVEGVLVADAKGATRTVKASLVVGADGRDSAVARLVGAPVTRRGRHATATIYGFWEGLEVDGYHWYWGRDGGSGTIPTNDGRVLVFVGADSRAFAPALREDAGRAFRRLLAEVSPALAGDLGRARLVSRLVGFGGRTGLLRRPWGPGWALVGDSANFKDPITAHGISDALRDAELLASAALAGTPEAFAGYERERDALSVGLFDLSDEIAKFPWETAALKELHRLLSDEMKKESVYMAARGIPGAGLALAS
jgi:2-polyprenyl-6-methoxyphenol hydroxylase-like FAD-dependent oxidoreductase